MCRWKLGRAFFVFDCRSFVWSSWARICWVRLAQVNKFISVSRRRSLLKSSSVSLIQSGHASATDTVEHLHSRLSLDWSPFGDRVSALVATPQYQLILGLLGFVLAVLIAYGQPINMGGLVVFVILYIAVLLGVIAMIESSFMFGSVFKSFDTLYLMGNCTGTFSCSSWAGVFLGWPLRR
jgi:hypothetical protein